MFDLSDPQFAVGDVLVMTVDEDQRDSPPRYRIDKRLKDVDSGEMYYIVEHLDTKDPPDTVSERDLLRHFSIVEE